MILMGSRGANSVNSRAKDRGKNLSNIVVESTHISIETEVSIETLSFSQR